MEKNKQHIFTYTFLALCFIFLAFIYGCSENNKNISDEKAQEIFEEATSSIPSVVYLGETIVLPEIVQGVEIGYKFDKAEYFDETNKVIKEKLTGAEIINLEVSISEHKIIKTFRIHQNMDEYLKKVMAYLENDFPSSREGKSLKLSTAYPGDDDLEITYTSSNPEFVMHDGTRIEHQFDEQVSLTCKITKRGVSLEKTVNYISSGISNEGRLNIAVEYINDFMENTDLKEGTVLPTTHPVYGGRFRWVSEDPTIVYDYETIHLPKSSKTTHLVVEVFYSNAYTKILKFRVDLDERPKEITDEDYAKTFITTVLKTTDDYMVLYDGTKSIINTEHIVDETQMSVNYKMYTDVVRPEVPQEKLDKLVYEGYQMPNEENVLWIVTHETGMSYAGKDALLLANLQYNTAISGGREASWGYTVDDHSVYQSFPDTYRLWHATDGRTIGGGNSNGIGIEMCVNSDGIYNVSMRNNARLMAGLLIKYKLGILNMKQHSDFYNAKSCPEIMRRDNRWFEYLSMISKEYVSQTILSTMNISYDLALDEMEVPGVFDCTQLQEGDTVNIKVTINEQSFVVTTTRNK